MGPKPHRPLLAAFVDPGSLGFFRFIPKFLGSPEFDLNLMVKVKFPNFDLFCNLQNVLASKIKIRSRSRNWLCLEFLGPLQKEAPRKVIYSALNIVVKRIRESRVIAFSVRKPYFSTFLAEVGNPAFSFISTENQGVSPRASRRGFLCPQKHVPGFLGPSKATQKI